MPVISMTEFLDYNDLILYVFCDILFSISRLFYIFNYYLFFIIYTLLHYLQGKPFVCPYSSSLFLPILKNINNFSLNFIIDIGRVQYAFRILQISFIRFFYQKSSKKSFPAKIISAVDIFFWRCKDFCKFSLFFLVLSLQIGRASCRERV